MVVLILSGGLGNQMFEYAAAKAHAIRSNSALVINTQLGFERDFVYKRTFALDLFNVTYTSNKLLTFEFPCGFIFEKISRKLGFHLLVPWYKYVYDSKVSIKELLEKTFNYRNVIFTGCFVKQDFFADQIETIRTDFQINKSCILPEIVKKYVAEINSCQVIPIALGVRIYQEISDQKLRSSEFYVDGLFYSRAIQYCRRKYGAIKLFVFTQAKEWVLDNIKFNDVDFVFVDTKSTDKTAAYDMLIMSKCKHFIISNSTFYWWGAWLNSNIDKEVIIPKQWELSTLQEWTRL